jgi:hypothetical protein
MYSIYFAACVRIYIPILGNSSIMGIYLVLVVEWLGLDSLLLFGCATIPPITPHQLQLA